MLALALALGLGLGLEWGLGQGQGLCSAGSPQRLGSAFWLLLVQGLVLGLEAHLLVYPCQVLRAVSMGLVPTDNRSFLASSSIESVVTALPWVLVLALVLGLGLVLVLAQAKAQGPAALPASPVLPSPTYTPPSSTTAASGR